VIQSLLLHCNSAILAAPDDFFVAKCMILMENGFPRDGLDHILNAVVTEDPVLASSDVSKVRTASQLPAGPVSSAATSLTKDAYEGGVRHAPTRQMFARFITI
jgi:hypothetical protein